MNRALAYLLLVLMILPLLIVPVPGVAQRITVGVSLKAGTYNFYNVTPTNQTVKITSDGMLRIIINRTEATELGTTVRISFIFDADRYDPNVGGYFLNASNIGVYAPTNPGQSPFGGVIDITQNSTLTDGTQAVGNVTVINGGTITIILIDLSKLPDLQNVVYVTNVYTETSTVANLTNTLLRVKVYDAASWDAVISGNPFEVIYIPVICSDVNIYVVGTPATVGSNVTITVSFHRFFAKVQTIAGVSLDIATSNLTLLKMINYYNISEEYTLASFINGNQTIGGTEVYSSPTITLLNASTFTYTGQVKDYAPTVADPTEPYVSAYYMFEATFRHEIVNETYDLVFTIQCNSNNVSSITTPYLRILATLDVTTIEVAGNSTTINPGDIVNFTAHNIPLQYLTAPDYGVLRFALINPELTVIIPASNITLSANTSTGVINGSFVLPDAPYGGRSFSTYLVFNDNKWVKGADITVSPYIRTYVLTNTSAYAEDAGNSYIGRFILGSTSAPGDYILIKGYGFALSNLTAFTVSVNATDVIIIDMHYNTTTGKTLILAKLLDVNGTPIPVGTGFIRAGEMGTPNNAYTPFSVVRGSGFEKVLFNPGWFYNGTEYYIIHDKLGDPYVYFPVQYPLVNDTFTTTTWPFNTIIEVIGWPTDTFMLKAFNKDFNMSFNLLNMSLVNGYGNTNLYGLTIPFLPYGNYTLLEGTLLSVDNRTVFTVYMGIDVDLDTCRNGTLSVAIVGAAPNTEYNFTFDYQANELYYAITRYIPPQWTGTWVLTIITDSYGTGSITVPLTTLYPTSYVTNATWDVITWLRLNGTGTLNLSFAVDVSYGGFTDNLTSPITYLFGPSDTVPGTFYIYVNATYNVTVTRVSVGYLPRENVVISVPETLLPGDTIVVQIFPHNASVWGMIIEPTTMFEENTLVGWYLNVRLVEPLTNNVVERVAGYYAGNLIIEDVDMDGNNEIWFAVNLTAPFILGVDKTYRVDVQLFLAVLDPTTNATGVSAVDNGCSVQVEINGTIYWNGYDTAIMLGGDEQIVTVLGVLEGKLDFIKNGIVVINATVNDINTYLKVDITDFLREINGSLALIKNDTVTLIDGQARIEAKLDVLLNLTSEVNDTVNMILACCNDVNTVLNRIEGTLNSTYTVVLEIRSNLSILMDAVNNVVIPKFKELYDNITVEITTSRELVIANISAINESLSLLITVESQKLQNMTNDLSSLIISKLSELYRNVTIEINASRDLIIQKIYDVNESIVAILRDESNNIKAMIRALNATLLSRLNDLEGTLIYYMTAYEQRLEGVINETADDIVYKLTITIDNRYDSLKNLITLRADRLEMIINDNVSTILATIGNVNLTVHSRLNELEVKLGDVNATVMAGIFKLQTDLENAKQLILDTITNGHAEILGNLSETNALILRVNETLTLKIVGEAENILSFLSSLEESMNTSFNNVITALSTAESNILGKITDANNMLSSKIDNVLSTLQEQITSTSQDLKNAIDTAKNDIVSSLTSKVDSSTQTLSGKLDDLKSTQESSTNSINSNISLFGTATLLLLVVAIGLVGYSLITRRPAG